MFQRTNRGRRLKSAAGTTTPSNFLIVAVSGCDPLAAPAAGQAKHRLRQFVAYGFRVKRGRVMQAEYCHGDTVQEFRLFAGGRQRARDPLWIMGHDLPYSLSLLDTWRALDDGWLSCGPILPGPQEERVRGDKPWRGFLCLESAPVFASLMGREGRVNIVDTMNYWACGISQLADAIGQERRPKPGHESSDEEHAEYLEWETNVVAWNLVAMLEEWKASDCGPWQKTAAGLAFASYRRFLGKAKGKGKPTVPIIARDPECEQLERQAFHGGRCEPFFLGELSGQFYKLDVCSLYPAMMAANAFPGSRIGRLINPSIYELRQQKAFRGCIADVLIDSDRDTYPVHVHGCLEFARGRFWTTLAGPELDRAIAAGHVVACHEAVIYKLGDLFSGWVSEWFGRKSEASSAGASGLASRQLSKVVLNALYGKFAQRGNRWVSYPGGQCAVGRWGAWTEVSPDGAVLKCRAIGGVRQVYEQGEPPAYHFPAISAYVTAYAREHMRRLMGTCPPKSVFYIGTDMIVVDHAGYSALLAAGEVSANTLGKLQVEGMADRINLVAPMAYRFGERWTVAGHWARNPVHLDGTSSYEALDRLPSILSVEPDGTVTAKTHDIAGLRSWAKGYIRPDGWVEPYSLYLPDRITERTKPVG